MGLMSIHGPGRMGMGPNSHPRWFFRLLAGERGGGGVRGVCATAGSACRGEVQRSPIEATA